MDRLPDQRWSLSGVRRGVISRAQAEHALTQTSYELWFAAPSKSAFFNNRRMPIYFAAGPSKWYPVGGNGNAELFIAPYDDIEYPEVIARRIGYRGSVALFSRNGVARG